MTDSNTVAVIPLPPGFLQGEIVKDVVARTHVELESGRRHVVLDFGGVTGIGTDVRDAILQLCRRIHRAGGLLALAGVRPDLKVFLDAEQIKDTCVMPPSVAVALTLDWEVERRDRDWQARLRQSQTTYDVREVGVIAFPVGVVDIAVAKRLVETIHAELKTTRRKLVVDCSGMTYVLDDAVDVLREELQEAHLTGATVILAAVPAEIESHFERARVQYVSMLARAVESAILLQATPALNTEPDATTRTEVYPGRGWRVPDPVWLAVDVLLEEYGWSLACWEDRYGGGVWAAAAYLRHLETLEGMTGSGDIEASELREYLSGIGGWLPVALGDSVRNAISSLNKKLSAETPAQFRFHEVAWREAVDKAYEAIRAASDGAHGITDALDRGALMREPIEPAPKIGSN